MTPGQDPAPDPPEDSARGPVAQARSWVLAAGIAAAAVPLLFYLHHRDVGPLGLGLTVFLVVLSLLVAAGLFFGRHTAYHTPVALRGDWVDRLGAL